MAINPKIQGDYDKGPRGRNDQGSPKGAFEDRIVSRGGQSIMGNAKARDVGGGGPGAGREVSKSGAQDQYGTSEREYQNPRDDGYYD
jgi:hypothetical protein